MVGRSMERDWSGIRRLIWGLVRRERAILVGRVGLRSVLLGGLLAIFAVMVPIVGARPSQGAFGLVVAAGVGALWALARPLWRGWRAAGDLGRQARLAEAQRPDFRGRLVASVERLGPGAAAAAESEPLVGLMVRRAMDAAKGLEVERIHPGRPLWRPAAGAVAVWLVVLPLLLVVPGGPFGFARFWFEGLGGAESAEKDLAAAGAAPKAKVGDLVLKYTYPDYTGLEPRIIPNSTGDVSGPPGTIVEVAARTAEAVESAAMVAYDQPPISASRSEDGRTVTGSFSIGPSDGTWHLVLHRAGEPKSSPDFKITVEPDIVPEVVLSAEDGGREVEVALDEELVLSWSIKDDYGLTRAIVTVDGREAGQLDLPAAPDGRPGREAADDLVVTALELGLKPGDEVMVQVLAWDNDTVSGSKVGESQKIKIKVNGARQRRDINLAQYREARDQMVLMLAQALVEPWPPGQLPTTSRDMVQWGERVGRRYEPIRELVTKFDLKPEYQDRLAKAVFDVLGSGNDVVGYTQNVFLPGDAKPAKGDAVARASELEAEAVADTEHGILLLDLQIQLKAMKDMLKGVKKLSSSATDLDQLLKLPEPDAMMIQFALDEMSTALEATLRASEDLAEGGLQEIVDSRAEGLRGLMKATSEAAASKDTAKARQLEKRLADEARDLEQIIRETRERARQSAKESRKNAKAVVKQLRELAMDERKLREKVAKAREALDGPSAARAAELWDKVQDLSGALSRDSAAYADHLRTAGRPFWESQRALSLAQEAGVLSSASQARDLEGAVSGIESTGKILQGSRMAAGSRPDGAADSTTVQGMQLKAQEISKLLGQLDALAAKNALQSLAETPELMQEQRQLSQRRTELEPKAIQAGQKLPIAPRGMEEALEVAGKRMGEAEMDLGIGNALQAEGDQAVAAEKVDEAADALEQAMQESAGQASDDGGGEGEEDGEEGEEGDGEKDGEGKGGKGNRDGKNGKGGKQGRRMTNKDMIIAEDTMSPEEYRRLLLEGMEGQVPEEFRALKKRYYEDLVRQ